MSSIVTVRVKYADNSKSLTEDYVCSDTHPSASIIKDLEDQMLKKWEAMGGQYRDVQIHSKVRQG
jgi:hypothetical protein